MVLADQKPAKERDLVGVISVRACQGTGSGDNRGQDLPRDLWVGGGDQHWERNEFCNLGMAHSAVAGQSIPARLPAGRAQFLPPRRRYAAEHANDFYEPAGQMDRLEYALPYWASRLSSSSVP